MNNIYMINGSPKIKKDNNSQYFIDVLSNLINKKDTQINTIYPTKYSKEDIFPKIVKSSTIIFVSPLYIDCLPSSLLRFIIDLEEYIKQNKINSIPKVYAIFNCGFFEGYQNKIALHIIKNFCTKAGFIWRFGVGIGGGEFMGGTKDTIPLDSKIKNDTFNALMEIKNDMENNNNNVKNNIFTSPKMPRFLFQTVGNISWIQMSKPNKIKIRDLYARPHGE